LSFSAIFLVLCTCSFFCLILLCSMSSSVFNNDIAAD
jgi:hypothetical protein